MDQQIRTPVSVTDGNSAVLKIELLGGLRLITQAGDLQELHGQLGLVAHAAALLALTPGRRLRREQIASRLWPRLDDDQAVECLQRVLADAQGASATGSEVAACPLRLHVDPIEMRLDPDISVDVDAFEQAAAITGQSDDPATYRAALGLYTGDLLPDFDRDEVVIERRQQLRRLFLSLLLDLARLHEEMGNPAEAIEVLQRAVVHDPAHEPAHISLMRLYAHTGQRHPALRQYEDLRQALQRPFGPGPSSLADRIFSDIIIGRTGGSPSNARTDGLYPPTGPRRAVLSNVPLQLTSFIGRDSQILEIKRHLATSRIVTLTGPGGIGKSRLALQLATDLIGQYWDGVWFVELSNLVDQARVSQVVASVLGVPEETGHPVTDVVEDFVRHRQLLLVLDTCSHAIEEIASFAERLLSVSAHLRLLVTSREILRVPGELNLVVPPLTVPDVDDLPSIDELLAHDGVRLFVDRARIHQPGFTVTEQNGPYVAQLCRRLDGLPLAIELAAARIRTLPVSELVRRLDDDLDLLANGSRNAPPRQRTLQATIDWSYNSLSAMEQIMFDRLSVFVGAWTLEAAEAVTASGDLEVGDVVDLLTALVNKSMVVVENDSEDRAWYRLLGILREYGRRRLVTRGDEPELQRRRAEYLLSLAERAEPELIGPAQASWLALLERLHPNLRAALAWSLESGQIETGMRLAASLWRFWYLRGSGVEGSSWFEAFIRVIRANQSDGSSEIVAKFYQSAGKLAAMHGEHDRAAELIAEALRRFRARGDRCGIADLISIQGMVARHQGDSHSAIQLFEESLEMFRDEGDRWGIATSLSFLGTMLQQKREFARAEALLAEGLAIRRELGHTWGVAVSLANLGRVMLAQGNEHRALAYFQESLDLRWKLGDKPGMAEAMQCVATVFLTQGAPDRAVRLCGVVVTLRETLQIPMSEAECRDYERILVGAGAALGDEVVAAGLAEGRRMSMELAIAQALSPLEARGFSSAESDDASGADTETVLTRREREVSALIAQGLTNRQIADELVISERTVDTHVANILRKLGFACRAQVAAWSVGRLASSTNGQVDRPS